jgi:hypothetical protein
MDLMSMRAAFQEKPAKTVRFGLVCVVADSSIDT